MNKSLSKNSLIAEIAASTGLKKKAVISVLNKLTEISYREAAAGFIIPGICKLKVITKKASRFRNPATGQMLMIGERQALKIIPLKKAKEIITPQRDDLIQVIKEAPKSRPPRNEATEEHLIHKMPEGSIPPIPDLPAAPYLPSEEIPSEPASSDSTTLSVGGDTGQIVFNCFSCGTSLAAPPSSAGNTCTCPFCSVINLIPSGKSNATNSTDSGKSGRKQPEDPRQNMGVDFITFVCQTCGQEIEAPIDMMGMDASCPTCASSLHVPASFTTKTPDEVAAKPSVRPAPGVNISSMTIRLDLSDLE